ncbi:MAG: EamA family transporter [Paracoccus sp. (in: a-proteobacteria)]|uniref:EamA family transporter n=1 Tax=Paracoccus sp. TaxID=267 RepID=UPI0026DEE33A|nr:EamA family transporter [Paracoccus sp. (in: a-proteobacteria)]MDO5630982.1 EamA family transporter [Paracoccus sp. (in: a-proteobacteria)]
MIWAVATIIAAALQTARNAAQAGLDQKIGPVGATSVRFIFGLPFALLAAGLIAAVNGLPHPTVATFGWAAFGAVAQIAATAFMLLTMRGRGFGVATALMKTEPITLAIIGALLLTEPLTLPQLGAILIAVSGVILISAADWSRASLRGIATGITAGALFGLSAIGFRGAILTLPGGAFVTQAALVLAITLLIQTGLCLIWLVAANPVALAGMRREWRTSVGAGGLGAAASLFWFIGFALTPAANVRTLALIEVVFAQIVSGRVFRQAATARQIIGMALILGGVILLLRVA